jgi:hypothetical protein
LLRKRHYVLSKTPIFQNKSDRRRPICLATKHLSSLILLFSFHCIPRPTGTAYWNRDQFILGVFQKEQWNIHHTIISLIIMNHWSLKGNRRFEKYFTKNTQFILTSLWLDPRSLHLFLQYCLCFVNGKFPSGWQLNGIHITSDLPQPFFSLSFLNLSLMKLEKSVFFLKTKSFATWNMRVCKVSLVKETTDII